MKKKIVRVTGICFLVLLGILTGLFLIGNVAQAAGLVDDTVSAEHLFSMYPLKNYQLDFYADTSWSLFSDWGENIGKSVMYGLYCITNGIWSISCLISNATGYVVQEAYELDFINDMADAIGKNMQTLAGVSTEGFSSTGLYAKVLLLTIVIVGIYVTYTGLIKRETSKAFQAVVNMVVVFIISAGFIVCAPEFIQKINEFSSDVSTTVLNAGMKIISPSQDLDDEGSVGTMRDALFSIQVEQPWLLLQYGTTDKEAIGAERIEELLSVSPSANKGADREAVVKEEIEQQNNENFTVTEVTSRFAITLFLFIFNIGISIFVFLLMGIMLLSQALFIVFAIVLPVCCLLSMIPGQEGKWKKAVVNLFNTIFVRAGITLVVTIAFSLSSMLYSLSGTYPFFMTMFLQIVVFAGIYIKLNDLMSMLNLQTNDTNQIGRRMFYRPYRYLGREKRKIQQTIRRMTKQTQGGTSYATKNTSSSRNGSERDSRTGENANISKNGSLDTAEYKHKPSKKVESLSKRTGNKAGAVADIGENIAGKAGHLKKQVKNVPLNTKYKVHEIGDQVKENVKDAKSGYQEERMKRRLNRSRIAVDYQNDMYKKRTELEENKQKRKPIDKNRNISDVETKKKNIGMEKPIVTKKKGIGERQKHISSEMNTGPKVQTTENARPVAQTAGNTRSNERKLTNPAQVKNEDKQIDRTITGTTNLSNRTGSIPAKKNMTIERSAMKRPPVATDLKYQSKKEKHKGDKKK